MDKDYKLNMDSTCNIHIGPIKVEKIIISEEDKPTDIVNKLVLKINELIEIRNGGWQ